jgi:hypothetical protein
VGQVHPHSDGRGELIQVCTSLADELTRQMELQALADAVHDPLTRGCEAIVIGLEPLPSGCEWLDGVRWREAHDWLLA